MSEPSAIPNTALAISVATLREDLAAQMKIATHYRNLYVSLLAAARGVIEATGGSGYWRGVSGAAFTELEKQLPLMHDEHDTANAIIEAQAGIGSGRPVATVEIIIERDNSHFPVEVRRDTPTVGRFTHPVTKAVLPFHLTDREQEEAAALFEP